MLILLIHLSYHLLLLLLFLCYQCQLTPPLCHCSFLICPTAAVVCSLPRCPANLASLCYQITLQNVLASPNVAQRVVAEVIEEYCISIYLFTNSNWKLHEISALLQPGPSAQLQLLGLLMICILKRALW